MALIVTLIHEENGVYGASFPDFPGAITGADDLQTTFRKASEMLAFHVGGMVEDGDEIPRPRTLDELRNDPEFREDSEGAIIALVEVDLPTKAVRVNVSIDEGLLKRLDRAASATGESRSAFLARAVKSRLATEM